MIYAYTCVFVVDVKGHVQPQIKDKTHVTHRLTYYYYYYYYY